MLMLLIAGCGNGWTKTGEGDRSILYVHNGYLCPPDLADNISVGVKDGKQVVTVKGAILIQDYFLVPRDVMGWMMKQIAEYRRLKEAGK